MPRKKHSRQRQKARELMLKHHEERKLKKTSTSQSDDGGEEETRHGDEAGVASSAEQLTFVDAPAVSGVSPVYFSDGDYRLYLSEEEEEEEISESYISVPNDTNSESITTVAEKMFERMDSKPE